MSAGPANVRLAWWPRTPIVYGIIWLGWLMGSQQCFTIGPVNSGYYVLIGFTGVVALADALVARGRRFWLALAHLAVVPLAVYAGLAMGGAQTEAREVGVSHDANDVRMALEAYADAHGGHYPAPADLRAALTTGAKPVLSWQANRRNPWNHDLDDFPVPLPSSVPGLPSAEAIARGTPLPAGGRDLAPASAPATPLEVTMPGALFYDRDPASETYVLYGITRHGGRAKVALALSNGGR